MVLPWLGHTFSLFPTPFGHFQFLGSAGQIPKLIQTLCHTQVGKLLDFYFEHIIFVNLAEIYCIGRCPCPYSWTGKASLVHCCGGSGLQSRKTWSSSEKLKSVSQEQKFSFVLPWWRLCDSLTPLFGAHFASWGADHPQQGTSTYPFQSNPTLATKTTFMSLFRSPKKKYPQQLGWV